jgi:protein required for attachment to host cells
MKTTWIVVANAQRARFFQRAGWDEDWEHLFDREPQARATLEYEDLVPEAEAEHFARQLADMLVRSLAGYERLVIAAPGRFLAQLHAALAPQVTARLDATLDTDRMAGRAARADRSIDLA